MILRIRLTSLFLMTALSFSVNAETVTWQDSPVTLVISQTEARKIIFPATIKKVAVREPIKQASQIFRTPNTNYFHWKAGQVFKDELAVITVGDGSSTKNYTLLVTVDDAIPDPELTITDPSLSFSQSYDMATDLGLEPGDIDPGTPPAGGQMSTTPMPSTDYVVQQESRAAYTYDQLAAFAAQNHMGPARLIKPLTGVTSIPVKSRPARLLNYFQGQTVPVKSWTDGDVYVTSVAIKNTSNLDLEIDVRWLRGRFLFFVPPVRLPNKNSLYNTAWLFVISEKPFWEAIK